MKQYRVQWVYPLQVGSPVIHNNEASAAGEVAYLLGTWIWRDMEDFIIRGRKFEGEEHPEFFDGLEYLLPQVKQLIGEGRVWEAYDLWEDFYLRFENEFGRPLYAKIPVVIVEGSDETGLKNKIPLIENTGVRPIDQYREKGKIHVVFNRRQERMNQVLRELIQEIPQRAHFFGVRMPTEEQFFKAVDDTIRAIADKYQYQDVETENAFLEAFKAGILKRVFPKKGDGGGKLGLGAMKSWLVQYADIGGAWHAGRHMNEDRAKEQARQYLLQLTENLGQHVGFQAMTGRHPRYVKAAGQITEQVHELLADERIWSAYLEYKTFEEKWSSALGPIPLEYAIGTMRVVPKPKAEA